MNDPSSGVDKTGEWEDEFKHRNGPKSKFPIKIKDDLSDRVNLEFKEPDWEVKGKKSKSIDNRVKVVTKQTNKKTKDNKKLF